MDNNIFYHTRTVKEIKKHLSPDRTTIIYLAGPISPRGKHFSEEDYIHNLSLMINIKFLLYALFDEYKIYVICPADDFLGYFMNGLITEKHLKKIDRNAIEACDLIIAISGWQESVGAKGEVEFARKLGKPVIDLEER